MLEVEPTGQRGPMTTGSGQNGFDLENVHGQYLENEERIELWLLLSTNRNHRLPVVCKFAIIIGSSNR